MGELLIMLIITVLIGIVGIVTMYLAKQPKIQDCIFYIMAFFGMMLGAINASSAPANYMEKIIISWLLGAIAVAGIIAKFKLKQQDSNLPKHLVAGSIVLGLLYLLFLP